VAMVCEQTQASTGDCKIAGAHRYLI
jgi:hypothetical protein